MDVYEAIATRRSVRAYKPEPVAEDMLQRILEAARIAPSGSNRQPWKFVVVRDEGTRRKLAVACHNQTFVGEAPVVIVAVGLMPDRVMSCQVPGDPVDVAIAVDHITLAAAAEGLGTCWIGAFDQDQVREIAGVPADAKVIAVLPLGHPADAPRPKSRKEMAEIVCYERFC